jgi:deazaflavin-dependent oxidoreductase (nitroreductase family)
MTPPKPPPRWIVNLNMAALRLGVKVGSQHLLSIPGRKSGRPRSTPVSIVTVGGQQFVVAAFSDADWVKNARAAGEGILARGRTRQRVQIVEIPLEERPAVLVEFLRQVPGGVRFFGLSADPNVIVRQADRYPVFRLDSLA